MGIITHIKGTDNVTNSLNHSTLFHCGTASSTANKDLGDTTFPVEYGISITVLFDSANTAANPKLVIGGTTYPVYLPNLTAAGNTKYTSWDNYSVRTFTYYVPNPGIGPVWIMNDYEPYMEYVHWQVGNQMSLSNTYWAGLAYSSKYIDCTIPCSYGLDGAVSGGSLSGGKIAIYGANGQILASTSTYPTQSATVNAAGTVTIKFTLSSSFNTNNNNKPAVVWLDSGAKFTFS